LPAIERILQLGVLQNQDQIGILVVSPTRELATQIGDQAEKLAMFHRGMTVQVMFGGTNMKRDITRLSQKTPTILVATPGRLLDHLQSTRIGSKRFGKDIMSKTPIVVLDETDRLLDMGFRQEITKILGYMPQPQERQTLLFSATIPPDLKVVMSQNMKKDFVEVDCINDGDASTHTNAQVQQSHLIIPSDSGRSVSCVVELVRLAIKQFDTPQTPAKIVVFFPTARLVNFYAELFNEGKVLPFPVLELHSKKTQSYRNRVSEDFRNAKQGVLFTSDVSARGTFAA
jgi:ATP-dependent RNA helicase MSS116, mitochondrial